MAAAKLGGGPATDRAASGKLLGFDIRHLDEMTGVERATDLTTFAKR